MPPEAYEIGLRPWDYARLTPAQYVATVAGYSRALERARRERAWEISWVTAPHVKRPISPNRILGITAHDEERRVFTEVGDAEPPRILLTDAD